MKRLVTALLLLLVAFGTGVLAYAQGIGVPASAQWIEWNKLNDEASSLYRQGHYDSAVVVAVKALQVAEHITDMAIRSVTGYAMVRSRNLGSMRRKSRMW